MSKNCITLKLQYSASVLFDSKKEVSQTKLMQTLFTSEIAILEIDWPYDYDKENLIQSRFLMSFL